MAAEQLKPFHFKKGQSGNPKGRPRKFVLSLKSIGYKMHEIADTIVSMIAMQEDEFNQILKNENATILERNIAEALKKDIRYGRVDTLEIILNRVFGRPKEVKGDEDMDNSIEIKIINPKDGD